MYKNIESRDFAILRIAQHYDGQLSTRQLSDNSQQITDTYTYDAFGILLNRSGATENNYLYTGEQYDPNVGFYYLRARYYNPSVGRFISMDTFPGMQFEPGSIHKYLYCQNRPLDRWDPSGDWTIKECVAVVLVIGIIISVCKAVPHHFISRAKTPVKWEGTFTIEYYGLMNLGIATMHGNLDGEQIVDGKKLTGNGSFSVYLGGMGAIIPTYTKADYTFYSPGIYGPNPTVLTGNTALGNISTFNPIWSLLGLTRHSPLEGEYIIGMYMGKGWCFGGGIYEGWDFGLDLKIGVSSMNSGSGPN